MDCRRARPPIHAHVARAAILAMVMAARSGHALGRCVCNRRHRGDSRLFRLGPRARAASADSRRADLPKRAAAAACPDGRSAHRADCTRMGGNGRGSRLRCRGLGSRRHAAVARRVLETAHRHPAFGRWPAQTRQDGPMAGSCPQCIEHCYCRFGYATFPRRNPGSFTEELTMFTRFTARHIAVVIVSLLAGTSVLGASLLTGVSLAISREVAPPGGLAQIKVSVTEPRPIST